jgi:hypothetical protein
METLNWRLSSYTGSNGGACVEVARTRSQQIATRDSKNRTGPQLRFDRPAFARLLDEIKNGEHDLA